MKKPAVIKTSQCLNAGLLVLFMLCFFEPLHAETNTIRGKNNARAHVDFVIHIPEALSLKIVIPHDAHRSSSQGLDGGNRAAAAQGTPKIAISAAGNLSASGVMTLTATGSDPLSAGQGRPVVKAGIIWTASGAHWTGGLPGDPSELICDHPDTSHAFMFHRNHRYQPDDTSNQIFYTISAP